MIENWFSRWIEVDLDAIRDNFLAVKKRLAPGVRVMAVVKSDAYGHGAVAVSRVLEEAGAQMLAVTTVEEGVELVRQGIKTPILVFAPLLPDQAGSILSNGLIATLDHRSALEALSREAESMHLPAKVHLKIETGMGRNGILPADVPSFMESLRLHPGVELDGVYSHLAAAMCRDQRFSEKQLAIFQSVLAAIKAAGFSTGIAHIANSAAILDLPAAHLDMVRVGTLLYGQFPSPRFGKGLSLKDPWQVRAKIVSVKTLPAGSSVGYGRDFIARREVQVAVASIGYADGFGMETRTRPVKPYDLIKTAARQIANMTGLAPAHTLTWQGNPLPVLGRIGMQMCMADATGYDIKAGDVVSLGIRRTTASSRLPRLYLKGGRLQEVRDISGVISAPNP